jgi:hypothetical protein
MVVTIDSLAHPKNSINIKELASKSVMVVNAFLE